MVCEAGGGETDSSVKGLLGVPRKVMLGWGGAGG